MHDVLSPPTQAVQAPAVWLPRMRTSLRVESAASLNRTFASQLTMNGIVRPPGERELEFAGVSPQQVADALCGRNPLGTTPAQWDALLADFGGALRAEGFSDVVVGITGSSVRFHSEGDMAYVRFPRTGAEVWEQAKLARVDPAKSVRRWENSPYSTGGESPDVHFWGSKKRLGYGRASDYDFTIYGADVTARMERYREEAGIDPDVFVRPEGGSVYCVKYLRAACPEVGAMAERWRKALGRPVDITSLPYRGPEARPGYTWDLTAAVAGDVRG